MGEEEKEKPRRRIEKRVRVSDEEDLRGVLKVVREEVPGLLKDITGPLKELLGTTYTVEEAQERAKAIAAFYKGLVDGGIDKDLALRMTEKNFINPLDLVNRFIETWSRKQGPGPRVRLRTAAGKTREPEKGES